MLGCWVRDAVEDGRVLGKGCRVLGKGCRVLGKGCSDLHAVGGRRPILKIAGLAPTVAANARELNKAQENLAGECTA
jgi:hypothetical protein